MLAAVDGGQVQLAAGVTADRIGKVKAGELVNFVAQQVGGKGGGKPDLAMAGGTEPASLGAGAGLGAGLGRKAALSAMAGTVVVRAPRRPTRPRSRASMATWPCSAT